MSKLSEIVYFGIVYAMIFTGYYVTNGFLTILYPDHAFIAFAVFYGVYAIFSLVSPFIYDKLNFRISLIISGFTFVVYVGLVSSELSYLLLIGAGICGAGNAVIWLIQGVWTTNFSNDKKGLYIGIFFGIFNTNIIIGNLIGIRKSVV